MADYLCYDLHLFTNAGNQNQDNRIDDPQLTLGQLIPNNYYANDEENYFRWNPISNDYNTIEISMYIPQNSGTNQILLGQQLPASADYVAYGSLLDKSVVAINPQNTGDRITRVLFGIAYTDTPYDLWTQDADGQRGGAVRKEINKKNIDYNATGSLIRFSNHSSLALSENYLHGVLKSKIKGKYFVPVIYANGGIDPTAPITVLTKLEMRCKIKLFNE